jgi:hypothetical protein
MLEADSSRAQVVSGGGEYAGGEVALEGGVVVVQLAEALSTVRMEFRCPVCNCRWIRSVSIEVERCRGNIQVANPEKRRKGLCELSLLATF